jgi:pyruvate/2-oxoglutarate dehydrogenase complex dihydrolipoamide acyltransferase (E2) component
MAFTFLFPDVGEGIHEATVVEWLIAEGDAVAVDQPMVKVETDKAVVELPSPRAGQILKLNAAAGDLIHVGDELVVIGEAGEDVPESAAPAASEAAVTAAPAAAAAPVTESTKSARRPVATPRTRALARRMGVDLTTIVGSGPHGRILDADVEQAAAGGSTPAAPAAPQMAASEKPPAAPVAAMPPATTPTADGPVERVPLTHLRKVIAGAMRTSKQISAHVTHVEEADVTDLMAIYRQLKPSIQEQAGVKFSVLPFFVKALVRTLRDFPMFNASVDEGAGELVLKRYYNIGLAVDTPEGLIVPVVKNADTKDMVTMAAEIADLAERARSRQLSLDEIRGGTCTVTNIGPLGGVFATPIINQPELAIIGLHKIQERPVVRDGEIVVRHMMYLSVSFDHRWIDGADAARFMSAYVRLVSNPNELMVRL